MKVQPSGSARKSIKGIGRERGRRGAVKSADAHVTTSPFLDALHAVQGPAVEWPEGIEALDEVAERLMTSPTPANLYEYRRLIGELLRRLLRGTFEVASEVGAVRAGRQKVFTLVRAVHRELEELTQLILARERDRFAIVAKLDQLRGLLLDLYR